MVHAGLVCSDPRGGELKKSRRNRGALHGDFHGGEADVFANYALPLHLDCDSSSCPSRVAKARERSCRTVILTCRGIEMLDTWIMPRERPRHD